MPRRSNGELDRITRSAEGLRRLGIGGTAVGSGLNAHPEYHQRMIKKVSRVDRLESYTSWIIYLSRCNRLQTPRISPHQFARWH